MSYQPFDPDSVDVLTVLGHYRCDREERYGGHRELHYECPVCRSTASGHYPLVVKLVGKQLWWCRHCSTGGDAPALVAAVEGLDRKRDFRRICEIAGCATTDAPAAPRLTPPRSARPRDPEPDPPPVWEQIAVERAIPEWQAMLWSPRGRETLDYLRGRGLTDETIRAARLGYNCTGEYDGRLRLPDGERPWVAVGVTIPEVRPDGRLGGVVVRRTDLLPVPPDATPEEAKSYKYKPKYLDIAGGHRPLQLRRQGSRRLLVVEGPMDYLLAGQILAGDDVDLATLGGCGQSVTPWWSWLRDYDEIDVLYDIEKNGAGDTGYRNHWAHLPRVRQLHWPMDLDEGKDLGEFVRNVHGDLRAFVRNTRRRPLTGVAV